MSPYFLEKKAVKYYPIRYRFLIFTAFGVILFAGAIFSKIEMIGSIISAFGFAMVTVSWTLFLTCNWFEPSKGAMRTNNWLGTKFHSFNSFLRWYSAIFLLFFLAVGIAAPIWWLINLV